MKNSIFIKELEVKIIMLRRENTMLRNKLIHKTSQIRHFRNRVERVQKSLDFILKHPDASGISSSLKR